MTERDFDTFLLLLKRTLRTGRRQRDAIVGELRDHLLERLDSLTEQGLSREEAMTQALEEFGDAAVLAAQFTSISRNRRRRLIMRTTLGTVVAAAAVVIAVVAFWPQGNHAPLSPRPLVAQGPPDPFGIGAAQPRVEAAAAEVEPSEEVLNDATMRKLKKPMDAEFIECPIEDALDFLAEKTGVQYYVDQRALNGTGLSQDDPISLQLKSVPCDMVLELILRQVELTYTVRNGILIVTTPEAIEAEMIVRVYDVKDLVAQAGGKGISKEQAASRALAHLAANRYAGLSGFGGGARIPSRVPALEAMVQLLDRRQKLADAGNAEEAARVEEEFYSLALTVFQGPAGGDDDLIDLITRSIDPNSWEEVGGSGTISHFQGKLVITQTSAAHRKINDLLLQLRADDKEIAEADGVGETAGP